MDIGTFLLLAGAGMIGGICNAVAGGGTFFTFPALLAAGVPPVVANATSAVSIWPGHASSLLGYRSELGRHRAALRRSLPVVGGGSLVGATLLVFTGDAQFSRLVPWLILVATVLFALGPWLRQAIERHARGQVPHLVAAGAEFLTALYGGYFGAGLGIMLMAILTLLGVRDVQEANAVKNAMATVVTSAAVMLFVATGSIAWAQGSAVLLGAIVGGYAGARLARWIPPLALRWTIVATGLTLAAYFGLKAGA
ncbi:sulfite exporter TauE/SafE family protein [Pseudomonas aeruginosa]|uniref:sulfite exporter TauE/SafE family protein n=1 Tax=Pseudomonas aeruginosa TaxID=287 RepID=UPI000DE5FB03|nr:sulfite exporter TauE/SafE family protein [Pseudomonas aeruginosa]SST08046.1 Sulfite exporter TauE/SafE [Acinetobacter baumannii]HBP5995044.1 sulfite exporter TauE/SafE family protein [Pseudomonas aeruginosa]